MKQHLIALKKKLEGGLEWDQLHKVLYATDASVYKMLPEAVAFPKNVQDLQTLVVFAQKHKTSLIPRAAGTSLAGQCVGKGIVVDVSRYFTEILDFNPEEKTVTVQPGVNRDTLNRYLAKEGLFLVLIPLPRPIAYLGVWLETIHPVQPLFGMVLPGIK